jgi:hypothetical protein
MGPMMREVFHCDTCGVETGFCINGVPYCSEHAYEGVGVQARLVASLRGAEGEELRWAGEWAQQEVAAMLGLADE